MVDGETITRLRRKSEARRIIDNLDVWLFGKELGNLAYETSRAADYENWYGDGGFEKTERLRTRANVLSVVAEAAKGYGSGKASLRMWRQTAEEVIEKGQEKQKQAEEARRQKRAAEYTAAQGSS
jgi:hypothetical protein